MGLNNVKTIEVKSIYKWDWNISTRLHINLSDKFILEKLTSLLENAINNDQDEFEFDYSFKWYKVMIIERDLCSHFMSGVLQDITSYKKQLMDYQTLAFKDTLTGYHNRLGLVKIMEKFDFSKQFAIIYIDLDNFKKLNDVYGHHAGDLMLKSVADAIHNVLPEDAHLARVSGDEFNVFIEQYKDDETLNQLAATILSAIIQSNDQTIIDDAIITASIGVAMSPHDANTYEELIAKADIAMYVAKKHGKAKYLFYNEQVNEDYYEYIKVHQLLIKAFRENEFKINYQPIYDLSERKIEAFEVSPYWIHPTKGLIAYEAFLQVLYEEGLIFTFDEWMIEDSVRKIAELREQGISIKFSINISPKHLALEHFHQFVENILTKYQVDGSCLYIEMVEFILKEDFKSINYNFEKLKELGCKIIIDGFGINHSTIGMLKDMNFDMIKIHKYFVETLFKEFSSEIIINTIFKLAKQHHKLFIADGVVDEQQFKVLREMDCEYAQGAYLSDPKPLEAIIEIIKRARKV